MIGIHTNDVMALGVGAILGALCRYQVGRIASDWIALDPRRRSRYDGWHTAAINIMGSLILGMVAGTPLSIPIQSPICLGADRKKSVATPPQVSSPLAPQVRPPTIPPPPILLPPPGSPSSARISTTSPLLAGLSPRSKLFLGVGFCGSYTTFSTYSLDVVTWLSQGKTTKAISYIMINNVGGIGAAMLGLTLAKKVYKKA